ncbi:MAG: radical SAM protein [Chloroflexi bacterium]|nr:radical SAM protein [Chloroflexota bacterium]
MFENGRKRVKPFYSPPSLLLRQAASALYFTYLTGWRRLPQWLLNAKKVMPTAAGALGMGCIGFPVHPVWEVTNACNLRCRQCHAGSGKALNDELSTAEGIKLLDDMAGVAEFRMLAFGGGEPLVRKDIFELVAHARKLGFQVSIATNGTLLTTAMARELKKLGAVNLAIGLNANDREVHESITGVPGSFERSKQAVYATIEAGLNLQINTSAMKENRAAIPGLLDFASEVKARIVLLYQLVPEGRGEAEMELSTREYLSLTEMVAGKQRTNSAIIEPTCSPQYWAYLMTRNGHGIHGKSRKPGRLAQALFKGCVAGSGLCYIKPDGEVWPCPFVPVSAGNVRRQALGDIWYRSELFNSLRDRRKLTGAKCRSCHFQYLCGGCRGRAYAHSGDYLQDDPLCFLSQ